MTQLMNQNEGLSDLLQIDLKKKRKTMHFVVQVAKWLEKSTELRRTFREHLTSNAPNGSFVEKEVNGEQMGQLGELVYCVWGLFLF